MATSAQAISSTQPTVTRSTSSAGRIFSTITSCSGLTFTVQPVLESGYCRSRRLAMPCISAWARATGMPAFSRPSTPSQWPPRCSGVISSASGFHSSTFPGKVNLSGMIPITVWGSPSTRIMLPRTERSPP